MLCAWWLVQHQESNAASPAAAALAVQAIGWLPSHLQAPRSPYPCRVPPGIDNQSATAQRREDEQSANEVRPSDIFLAQKRLHEYSTRQTARLIGLTMMTTGHPRSPVPAVAYGPPKLPGWRVGPRPRQRRLDEPTHRMSSPDSVRVGTVRYGPELDPSQQVSEAGSKRSQLKRAVPGIDAASSSPIRQANLSVSLWQSASR